MLQPFETILFQKADGVAHIVLNRPRVINAYNMQMRDEMWQALVAARDDPEVKVAILRGAGERGLCAGADLTEFGTAPSQVVARQVRFERAVWELWLGIPKPFICAAHGFVLGSGVEMALLCDLRIASEDAQFGLPEVALGMIPAAGGTQTLPRTIGIPRALEMLLTNRRVGAAEALQLGLVQRVVPRERLLAEAESLARLFVQREPVVLGLAKEAVRLGMDLPLPQALGMEERLALRAAQCLLQG
ncbi:MAG: enoyl-CoA hydratase/isomerase family protein [Chloroflexi bacterium]|nr:enoyl-CoA hydratase/isomerase family protein [Chloroflexota bacterium]